MLTPSRLQIGFAILVLLLLGAHAGAVLRPLYPIAALLVGVRLLSISSAQYVSFVIWLWVLSPLVRRVADLQAGPQEPSLVLLTPYLVAVAGAGQAATRALVFAATHRLGPLPGRTMFLLAALGASIGIPVGFGLAAPDALVETLNWIVPLVFGAYVASCVEEVPQIERAVATTFGRVALVVGAYGIYQFFSLPEWDAQWMLASGMRSIGSAEAFAVRVFSVMHSPGVVGYFTLVPLVLWLARPRLTGLVPVCVAAIVLLLSQVRAAWLGFAIAAILTVLALKLATGLRVVLLAVFGALCVTPFLQLPEVSERVSARLESLQDIPSYDQSAVARLEGHRRTFEFIADYPTGTGIGSSPTRIESAVGMRDSVLVASLVQFGLLGTVLYGLALCALAARLWTLYRSPSASPEAIGLACAGLGMLSTLLLGMPTAGPAGVVLWMIGGLAAARAQRDAMAGASS